jgi:hypothetical protein
MVKFRTSMTGALALAAAFGATVLTSAAPARAADDEAQARKACRQIAKNRDWKGTDADVRKESGNRIVVMMTGERKGQDRDRRCVYDTKTNKAQFEDQRGPAGRAGPDAGAACRAHSGGRFAYGTYLDTASAPLAIHGRLPPRKGFRRVRRSGLGCRHPSGLDGPRPPAPMSSADRLPIITTGSSALGKSRAPPIPVRPLTPSSTLAPAARGSSPGRVRPAG